MNLSDFYENYKKIELDEFLDLEQTIDNEKVQINISCMQMKKLL